MCMEALIRLLIYLLAMLFSLGTTQTVTEPPMPDVMRQPIMVEEVNVLMTKSLPPQVRLVVTGMIQDGCDFPVQMTETQDGNTITVTLFRELPMDAMCPMMIASYDETLALSTPIESGQTYTVIVNDVTVTFDS